MNRFRVILAIIILILILIVYSNRSVYCKDCNVVLISIDTLRPDHMGIYGYQKDTTPNIDKWANDATVFTNAYNIIPATFPSFTTLMTGRSPLKTHIFDNRGVPPIGTNSKTLAAILKQNGYATGAFTSIQIATNGLNQGFDTDYYKILKNEYLNGNETVLKDRADYNSLAIKAAEWLEKNQKNKFFLWVHLLDPHAPYYPPKDARCKFNQKYCGQIANKSLEEIEQLRTEYEMCHDTVPNDRVEMMKTLYDGGVFTSDKLVGLVLDKVKSLNLNKKTIVILYADHGEGLDHNYYFTHGQVLYNSAIHIPLIIKYPEDLLQPKRSDIMLQNLDILPSIADLLGIKLGINLDGTSFSNVFRNNIFSSLLQMSQKRYFYSINSTLTKFAVYDGRYKYIYSLPGSCLRDNKTEELYDMKNDYNEEKNIAATTITVKDTLKKVLLDYLSEYNLPMLNLKYNYPLLPLRSATPSSRIDFRFNSIGE